MGGGWRMSEDEPGLGWWLLVGAVVPVGGSSGSSGSPSGPQWLAGPCPA